MEIPKQEIELFLPLSVLWSKNVFYKCFSLYLGGSKLIYITGNGIILTGNGIIQTGKGIIQTGNGIISPTSRPLIKNFLFCPRGSRLIFITGNGIIQTGTGIIYPSSRPLLKKHLLENVSHLIQGVPINFQNRKWKYLNRK